MLIKHYLFALVKKQKLIFLSMALMSALTFSLFVGFGYASDNYQISIENYFSGCKYPSAFITTDFTKSSNYECLNSVEGVDDYDARFSSIFNFGVNNDYYVVLLNTYNDDDFSKFEYMSEYIESSNPGVFVDQRFADKNNINAGDTVIVGTKGNFCTCTVSQIVLKPENYFIQILNEMQTDTLDYGAIYLNQKDLEKFLNTIGIQSYGLNTNQVLLNIDPTFDKQEVLDNCSNALSKNVNVTSKLLDENTPSVKLKEEFIKQTTTISESIPFAFLVIMSLIFILFLIQIIKKQNREIGIFLASGYQKTHVYLLFVSFTLLISIISIVIGCLLSILFGQIAFDLYTNEIYLPKWTNYIFMDKLLLNSFIIIVVGQIACAISALMFRKSSPMDALEKSHQDYINFGKSVETFLNKLPMTLRLAINSIIQNYRNFITIVLGFIASFVMIFSAFSVYFSMQEYINYTYDVQNNYGAQIVCPKTQNEDVYSELQSNDNFTEFLIYNCISAEINNDDKTLSAKIIDFPSDGDMLIFKDAYTGEKVSIPEDGIIMDKLSADELGVKPGSFVEILGKKLEVKSIIAMYTEQYQIVSINQMNQLNTTKSKYVLTRYSSKEKVKDICANSKNTLYPIFVDNFKKMQQEWKSPLSILVDIVVLIAVMLGFVVVCTISRMILDKQKRIISILRCQGMQLFSVSNYWSIQMIIQLTLAFIIGLPLSKVVGSWFVNMLCSNDSYYPFIDNIWIYLFSFAIIIAFAIISHIIVIYAISKFKIAKNVQSRE